ncbi:MAG: hypothetical protein KatS3mg087_1191 [Patescibacteria group bacterium]|nr:MAG: hypothetical protein KatS3mg087_1191 [Patescibacteria group bacterium]
MKNLVRLFDWFSQTTSKRWTINSDDFLSVLRTVIMAAATAGLAELAARASKDLQDGSVEKILTYIIIAAVLQLLRKWAGNWK